MLTYLYEVSMAAWVLLLGCIFSGYSINNSSARPLLSKGSPSAAWSTAIATETSELLVPVVDIATTAEQGPCQAGTEGLIPLHYTVTIKPGASAAGQTGSANLQTAFPSVTANNQPTLQPCLVMQQQQQQQQQKTKTWRQVPKERMQTLTKGQSVSYTAYFRALSRDLCGTVPKVVIAATVQSEDAQQPQPVTQTTEIDVIPWGCAWLIGDADSAQPPVPAGMPGPKMTAAAVNAPAAADAPVLM